MWQNRDRFVLSSWLGESFRSSRAQPRLSSGTTAPPTTLSVAIGSRSAGNDRRRRHGALLGESIVLQVSFGRSQYKPFLLAVIADELLRVLLRTIVSRREASIEFTRRLWEAEIMNTPAILVA